MLSCSCALNDHFGGCLHHTCCTQNQKTCMKKGRSPTGSEQVIKLCKDKHKNPLANEPWGSISSCPSSHPFSQQPLQPHEVAEQETRGGETARKETEKQEKLKTHPHPLASSSLFCTGCEHTWLHPAPASRFGPNSETLGEVMLRTDTTHV